MMLRWANTNFLATTKSFRRRDVASRRRMTTADYRRSYSSASGGRSVDERDVVTQEKPAYFFQRGSAPLLDETVGELLGRAAKEWPNRECVVSLHQNVRLTFSEVVQRADRLAAGLHKLGMQRGDRLGIWGPNDLEWFLSCMGAARAGLIAVAINPAYQFNELVYCLRKVDVKAVIAPDSFKTQNYVKMLLSAREACASLDHVIIHSEDPPTNGTHRFSDVESAASRIDVERIGAEQDAISCYDGCNIQFTSGTTGQPKATLLSHKSLVNNSRQCAQRSELRTESKACLNVPFFHAFGLIMGQLATLHAGSTLVLEARSFDPSKSLEAIVGQKCTATYGTPTMWINLIDAQDRINLPLPKLLSGSTGGAPASPQLYQRIRESLRLENMKTIYGLTETTAVVFQSLPGEDKKFTDTTVGHLSDHVEAMIVDDNGSQVPFGAPGELWIRGYCNMMGYWGDEENTRKTLTETGWLKTGDRFVLLANGYGQIIGRKKDMLIRGGENIFPKEIEDFLMSHPSVLEAQVIGAFDDVYGEEICACIRLRSGTRMTKDELRNYCKGRIAHFKIPRYIEFVNEYPKTQSGKVKKFRLREELESKGVIPARPT